MAFPLKVPGVTESLAMFTHGEEDQFVSRSIRQAGIWEHYETELIVAALKKADNFIDVGANIGYYSVLASSLLGVRGKVFSFEPEQRNFALLEKNIRANQFGNVSLFNCGLSSSACESEIFLSENNLGDHQVYDAGKGRVSEIIKLERGDDLIGDDIDKLDIIKIDTQGAEYHVLSGLEQTLAKRSDQFTCFIEFWPFGLRKAGAHGHQLLDILFSWGLPVFIIDHIDERLIPCQESDLRAWVDELVNEPENEGFMNLLVGHHD